MGTAAHAAQQLDLFPLHPEESDHQDDHVSFFFETDYVDCGAVATLSGLLGTTATADSSSSAAVLTAEDESPSPSSSVNYVGLARAALRGREKLVFCYSQAAAAEVAAGKEEGEEASSGGAGLWCAVPQALSLKLDYEEIMNAWSDKGPLYIDGEAPQVVPEYHHTHNSDSVFVELGCMGRGNSSCSSSSLWKVPEMGGDRTAVEKAGNYRESRVMRYKEKRQNRLFSKRIRYEVRKLNADKRPRMKGRFVKRKDGAKYI